MFGSVAWPCETLLALVAAGHPAPDHLRTAFTTLAHFARLHPLARPRLHVYRGLAAAQAGRAHAARRDWERAATWAAKLALPFEAAWADALLAKGADGAARARQRLLDLGVPADPMTRRH
jgi:hypothetical protein